VTNYSRSALLRLLVLTLCLTCTGSVARVCADQPATAKSPGWTYGAVDTLSRHGLLDGYGRGPFPGPTSLTRPEAATLTLRAIGGVARLLQAGGQRLSAALSVEAAAAQPTAPGPASLSAEDLALVQRLIREFGPELQKLGATVSALEESVADLQQQLAKVQSDAKSHQVYGYLQLRFSDDAATTGATEFLLRRARLNVAGPGSSRTSYRIELQLDAREAKSVIPNAANGSKVQVRSVYIDHKLGTGRLRIGQAKIPFGYEVLESVPVLWASERAAVMDALIPDQRDIGVQYRVSDKAERFTADLGVFNGTGINRVDDNDAKDIAARLDYDFGPASAAVSYYNGTEGPSGASKGDRLGFGVRGGTGDFEGMGEYVIANQGGADVAGWYAQAGWRPPNTTGLLFVKHDQYDPDTDAADTTFRRTTLGYWHELDAKTRLSLVYEIRDPDSAYPKFTSADGNRLFLQMQAQY